MYSKCAMKRFEFHRKGNNDQLMFIRSFSSTGGFRETSINPREYFHCKLMYVCTYIILFLRILNISSNHQKETLAVPKKFPSLLNENSHEKLKRPTKITAETVRK